MFEAASSNSIVLQRLNSEGKTKTFTAERHGFVELPIGGSTGIKFELKLQNPLHKDQSESESTLTFFAKEYPLKDHDSLQELTKKYAVLRKMGYPVPNTARTVTQANSELLVLTDMTESGKAWLWGYNDKPNSKEDETLLEMNLSQADIEDISRQVFELAEKANNDGVLLFEWYFHVKKYKGTKEISVAVLDVHPTIPIKKQPDYDNKEAAYSFVHEFLLQRLKELKGSL